MQKKVLCIGRAFGRIMYLSHSRMDIQWAVRMLACKMRSPTQHDMRSLRHLDRYLEGTKDMAVAFPKRNQAITQVECYCDSDWASHHNVCPEVCCTSTTA